MRRTIDQLVNNILAIDKICTLPQRALDAGGLIRFMGPTVPLPLFTVSVVGIKFNILLTENEHLEE